MVEDDKHTSRLNRSILEDEGYTVACAGSGEEALNMLTATTPSLVLLDVLLPEMDGFTTFEKIREHSQVPIIFVSTEDRDEDMVRGLDMGADDYIAKPFSTSELTARVKAVLRRTSSTRPTAPEARPGPTEPDMSFLDKPEEVAGNIPGKTQTLPLAIFSSVQLNKTDEAMRLVAVSIALAVVTLAAHNWLLDRSKGRT